VGISSRNCSIDSERLALVVFQQNRVKGGDQGGPDPTLLYGSCLFRDDIIWNLSHKFLAEDMYQLTIVV